MLKNYTLTTLWAPTHQIQILLFERLSHIEFCPILVALNVHWIRTKLVNNFIPFYLMLGLKDDWK